MKEYSQLSKQELKQVKKEFKKTGAGAGYLTFISIATLACAIFLGLIPTIVLIIIFEIIYINLVKKYYNDSKKK